MNIKDGYVLRADQLEDPAIWRTYVNEIDCNSPASIAARNMVAAYFGAGRSRRLATWGRDPAAPDGPHWIGVRNGTTLHTDPRYPRYTHQLVLHNGGWGLAGIHRDLIGEPYDVGTVFCCDTHSPHILVPDDQVIGERDMYYLAASMDSRTPLPMDESRDALLRFVATWKW